MSDHCPLKWKPENHRAKCRKNSGKKWREKIKKGQQKIKANSLEDNGKLIVFLSRYNYLKTRTCLILSLGLAQILLTASARITLHITCTKLLFQV